MICTKDNCKSQTLSPLARKCEGIIYAVLPLIFGHLNSLPYLFHFLSKCIILFVDVSKTIRRMVNNVDFDQASISAASGLCRHCLVRHICRYRVNAVILVIPQPTSNIIFQRLSNESLVRRW